MPSDTKTRTILLADLVGSTSQVTQMETEQGADFLQDATSPIKEAVIENDGRVVKFTGDGYFATFESADDALAAAEDIRNHFMRQRYTPAGIQLDGVRIVINTADIVLQDNDIVGDGVIVTARLEKYVPTNAIWVTAATREVCSSNIYKFEDMGKIELRGRSHPVQVYALQDSEASYVEHGITLVITDMHRYVTIGESLSPAELNDWLLKWGNLHREAVHGLKGRVRQFIADMSLLTFSSPDEAYHALLNLEALVKIHNEKSESGLPNYNFKACVCTGDLILSPTGVVGPLVNMAFEVLDCTPRDKISLDEASYSHLENYTEQFVSEKMDNMTLHIATSLPSES